MLPIVERSASSHRTAGNNMATLLERRGSWIHLTEGGAYALYEAWWGKDITTRTIQTIPNSDDIEDVNDASTPPPVGVPILHAIVDIDQAVGNTPIGEILLRREFVTMLEYIESFAHKHPQSGVIVTGQPGIGEH